MIKNVLEIATYENMSVPLSLFDHDDHLLGVKNGVIDLRTGKFRKAEAEDYLICRCNVEFIPDAECERWKKFVLEIMDGDLTLAKFFQRLIGYMLLGGNPEQILVVLHGNGANGKSTAINVLQKLFGSYAKTIDSSTLMLNRHTNSSGPSEDIARLAGARITFTTEVAQGQLLNEDLIKKITGGDKLIARIPYAKKSVEFLPKFTPIMATNHTPIIQGDDHAIWRRIILIPFTRTFTLEQQDRSLPTQLSEEIPGILNWALEGLSEYQEICLSVPEIVNKATQEYQTDMDLLSDWIEDSCEISENMKETTSILYQNFECWRMQNSEKRYFDKRSFGRKLSEKGFIPCKVSGQRGFKGLSLRPTKPDVTYIRQI